MSAYPHVLVVDDDEAFHEFWLHELTERYSKLAEFRLVGSLDEAFRELYRKDDYYDIVLLDLGLPPFWGIDTYRQFLQKVDSLPIIVITANEDAGLDLQLKDEGASRVIWKSSVTDGTGNSRGETIVKAVVDVFLELNHSTHIETEFNRVVNELRTATSGMMDAVSESDRPPSLIEQKTYRARAAETELITLLTQETLQVVKDTSASRRELKSLRATVKKLDRRLSEQTRETMESITEIQQEHEINAAVEAATRTFSDRAWGHRKEIIALLIAAVTTIATSYFSFQAGAKNPDPPQPSPVAPTSP